MIDTIQKHILYDGKYELMFDPVRHEYSIQGRIIPSVTQILDVINKPALVDWAAKMAVNHIEEHIEPGKSYDELQLKEVFKEARRAHWKKKVSAGDIGSFVHDWVEQYIKGEKPKKPVNKELAKAVNRFLKWEQDNEVEFLISEQVVFSERHQYVGTLDFICRIKGELYIGDLKTSKNIYNEYVMQTAAYRRARVEEFPDEKYAGQLIVQIGRDGSFKYWKSRDDGEDYTKPLVAFLAAQKTQQVLEEMEI